MLETKKTLSSDIIKAASAVYGNVELTDETIFDVI